MQAPQFGLHAAIEEHHWWFLGRRRIIGELVRRIVPASRRELIVDVGCGTGGNLAAFTQDYSCLGIDPSSEAIRLARSRFPNAQFICGAITDALHDVRTRASLLLLTDVLEHVPDDFLLLSTLLEQLKPGTCILITVPANMALWTEHDVSFSHYRRYDLQRLQRVWLGLPVTPLLVSYYNARLYPIVWAIRAVNRVRGRASGIDGSDFHTPPRPLNDLLQRIFASETRTLVDCLEGRRPNGFSRGVSLIAIVRREEGVLHARTKPADIAPDLYNPLENNGHP